MTRERHSMTEQLEALVVQQTEALGVYDRLVQETDVLVERGFTEILAGVAVELPV